MNIQQLIQGMGKKARQAAFKLAELVPQDKNQALIRMAELLEQRKDELQGANEIDLEAGRKKGLSSAMLDRLELTEKRIAAMCNGLRTIASLEDPVGEIYDLHVRPNGLQIGRMRVPIGVVGIIYESRPNVTADAAALCLKSGNAVLLRGGSEALNSNRKIAELLARAATEKGIPEGAIQVVPVREREAVNTMLTMNEYIDLIIPRGGKSLIETVVKNSTIPVIKHYDGNCYIYVDEFAELKMAREIVVNAKTQRPGVCNALESLLIHKKIAPSLLEQLVPELQQRGVELRVGPRIRKLFPALKAATDEDWVTEYLDLILSMKMVYNFDEAIEFINMYGSHHTDAIITQQHERAMEFLKRIDSACVFVNCSTRFSDGGEFGMGAEIGISTDKLHARGPMALRELTTYKFIAFGRGQLRS